MQQSRYLVVICSPDSANSRWVEEEIRLFTKLNGRDRTIGLIARGLPNASDKGDNANECFPSALRFDWANGGPPACVEPIAADMRPEGDGKERAFLKIVAGLLGVGFDDLYQREKRRQRQRQILGGLAAAAAILILAATWWWIASLGKAQTQIRQDVVSVQKDAAVATTEFKDVRPRNKEAEERIGAVADRASKALDALERARLANAPDAEYTRAYEVAGGAIVDVEQEARTTEESIYAREVARPLRKRMYDEGQLWSQEMQRRANEKINRMMQQMQGKRP